MRGQVGQGDDEGAGERPAQFEFLQQQPGHDGLAGAGVVGQQEAQAGLAQHAVVDGLQLVGQGINAGHADGELRVVGVGQADAGGLRRQAEAGRVPHKRGAARFGSDLQARQVLAFEQAGDEAGLVVEGNGLNQHAG